MASQQIENFGDLLVTTLANFHEPDYTNLTTDLTDFPAAKQLIKPNTFKYKSGKSCDWKIKVQNGNAARNIAITDHDSVNIVDGFIEATVNWRKSETKYAFYEEEQTINMTPKRLVNLIESREHGAQADWVELLENNFWRFPAATDTRVPFGLPYWCTKNATTGFNGGIPTGYSLVANVSPTTYARWNNYTAQYTAVTIDDFVRKARVMRKETKFKPAVSAVPDTNKGDKLGLYGTLTLTQRLADLVDARNDNLGSDLSKNDDGAMLGRTVVEYVHRLNEDTTDPFYQINWGVFRIAVLSTWWMKRKVISPYPGQRNVSAVFIDSVYQLICYNRRLLGVMATGTSYP